MMLSLFLIFFEFRIGLMLCIEMGEDLIVYSELEGFSLLDYVQCESIEGEGILERHIGW